MGNMERRRQERFPLQIKAKLSLKDKDGEVTHSEETILVNISSGGAFFLTEEKIPMATRVYLEFSINVEDLQKLRFILSVDTLRTLEGKQVRVKATAVVIRAEKDGFGIIFDTDYQLNPMQPGK